MAHLLINPATVLSQCLPGLTRQIPKSPYPQPLGHPVSQDKRLQDLTIKKKTQTSAPTHQAMELEKEIPAPTPSTSLGNTQTPHSDMEEVEIQPLTKEDKIAHLVKIHVANYQKFVEAQKTKATQDEMMTLLGQAQKSQKELRKLISKKEVEEYVKGWNPWEEKIVLFPQTHKKHKGKNMSSLSMSNRNYKNPQKWNKVANIRSALTSFYNSID